MGSTPPPVSQRIQDERRVWAPLRRALRRAHQAMVAQCFECAKRHVQAGVSRSCRWLFEGLAWSEVRVSGETGGSPATGGDLAGHASVDPRERHAPRSWAASARVGVTGPHVD
jgi:hypothetical protein